MVHTTSLCGTLETIADVDTFNLCAFPQCVSAMCNRQVINSQNAGELVHERAGSGAIDLGPAFATDLLQAHPALVADIDGQSRFLDGIPDAGADEFP